MRYIIVFFCICFFSIKAYSYSYVIDVNIYAGTNIKEISVSVLSEAYDVFSGNKLLFSISKNKTITITIESKKISIAAEGQAKQNNITSFKLVSKNNNGVIRIKPTGNFKTRTYDDNLTVTVEGNNLRIINNVDIEKYVAGVVEAETGSKQTTEFYKVQAVACRTYVLRNIRRHIHEGFNVCDKEHCQVYYGKCYNADILKAVENTNHFVIIDKELNFISAVFHSNCGGQTVNSEHVWSKPSTYLKSIKDTFCLKSKNAVWNYEISKDKFLNLLQKNYNFPVTDSLMVENAISFNQDTGRRVFFLNMPQIHLKNIREDLKLKSTFFSIHEENDKLIFRGRGFGHGVGLCQEGAMEMIEKGYSYDDIIKFYYTDVYIVSYEDILKLNK